MASARTSKGIISNFIRSGKMGRITLPSECVTRTAIMPEEETNAGNADGEGAKITIEAFDRLCQEQSNFHEIYGFETQALGHGWARVRMPADERHVRPGGTISGPAQMALADFAFYAALLGAIGPVPLAVTTNLSIHFLRRPAPGSMIAEAKLIKLGKRLAVGEVMLHANGSDEPVTHVTGTYSIPPS
jgi:uncharacterized protein (TIGR00369 family)